MSNFIIGLNHFLPVIYNAICLGSGEGDCAIQVRHLFAPQETTQFMEECRSRGLLVGKGGLYGNVIRMSPPLNIAKSDVDEAIRIMDEALSAVRQPAVAAAR